MIDAYSKAVLLGVVVIAGCDVPIERFHSPDSAAPTIDAAVPVPDAPGPNDFALEFDTAALPSALGWTYDSDCPELGGVALSEAQAVSSNGGFLHADTTAPSSTVVDAYYIRHGLINTTRDWAIEARLRVTALENAPPTIAQAFGMVVIYGGDFYVLQVGYAVTMDEITYATVNTSDVHVYRMRKRASETNVVVEVDGVEVLTGPRSGSEPISFNRIAFGDTTCQSRNGAVDLDYIRFTQQ